MAAGAELTAAGIALLAGVLGTVAGEVEYGGSSDPFASGIIADRRRAPDAGQKDLEEIDLVILASEVPTARRDSRVTFTTYSGETWLVVEAEPIAPGGEVVAWSLLLRNWITSET